MNNTNKFLSLDWFKSKVEVSIDRVVANKLEKMMGEEQKSSDTAIPKKTEGKPYFSMKLVNDTLTVVLNDGAIITKPNACEDDYYAVTEANSVEEILAIVSSAEVVANIEKAKAEAARIRALQQGLQILAVLPDFKVEGNTVYLAGTSRSMPQLLVEKFIEIVDRVADEPSQEVFLQDGIHHNSVQMSSHALRKNLHDRTTCLRLRRQDEFTFAWLRMLQQFILPVLRSQRK